MKFSTFTISFARDSTPEEIISTCAEVGLDGVDMRVTPEGHIYTDMSKNRRKELLEYAGSNQINFFGLMGYGGEKLFSPDEHDVEKQLQQLEDELELAIDLNAQYIRIVAGISKDYRTVENMKQFIKNVKRICPKAEDLGLDVCLEIHPGLVWNADTCIEVIEGVGSERLRVIYDPSIMVLYDPIDPVTEGEKIKDFIYAVHLKDYITRKPGPPELHEWVPLGNGECRVDEVLRFLKRINFDQYICVEYLKFWEEESGHLYEAGLRAPLPDPKIVLSRELSYLKNRLL